MERTTNRHGMQGDVGSRGLGALNLQISAAENSAVPIAVLEGKSHAIGYANAAFRELFEAPVHGRRELDGKPLSSLFRDPERVEPVLDRVCQNGQLDCVTALAHSNTGGPLRQSTVSVFPFASEQSGRSALLVQVVVDAAPSARATDGDLARDLQQANEELILASLREHDLAERAQRSAAEMRALLGTMMEGVSVFDAEGRVVLVNACCRSLFRFPSDTPSLDDFRRFDLCRLDGAVIGFQQDFVSRLLRGQTFVDEEIVYRHEAGKRHLLVSGSAVRDAQGRVVLAILLFRDVTDLRDLERQREQYISLISHDLLGPLAAAHMGAQLLTEHGRSAADEPQVVTMISRSLARMDRMVRDLLDVQRLKARQSLVLHLAECDAVSIAEDLARELATLHGDRFQLDAVDPARGIWSAEELRRALWNLALNAVKYGSRHTPIVLSVRHTPSGVALSVHNSGTPIPPEEQARLFAPFAQSQSAVARGPGGWGLGLTLVRGCAEAHGGTVRVESGPESGTTFTIELPLDARLYQANAHATG